MRRFLGVLCTAFVLAIPTLCLAHVQDQLVVDPAEPLVGDEVTITGGGWMPDGCWSFEYSYDCAIEGNAITLTFHTTDLWTGGSCVTIVQDFSGSCALGALPAGVYTVEVVELRNSPRVPLPSTQTFEFEVQRAVAIEEQSWSTLKERFEQP